MFFLKGLILLFDLCFIIFFCRVLMIFRLSDMVRWISIFFVFLICSFLLDLFDLFDFFELFFINFGFSLNLIFDLFILIFFFFLLIFLLEFVVCLIRIFFGLVLLVNLDIFFCRFGWNFRNEVYVIVLWIIFLCYKKVVNTVFRYFVIDGDKVFLIGFFLS